MRAVSEAVDLSLREPLDALDTLGPLLPEAAAAVAGALALPWHGRVLALVSAYLPLLLMALLALGTWWLVRNTPLAPQPKPALPPRHEADYTMRGFTVQRFAPGGPLRAQIDGDVLRHYGDTDTTEIDAPRVTAHALDGRVTRASAKRALANGDASEVQLLGDARVTSEAAVAGEPPLQFRGEFLHAFLRTEQLRSHLPATLTRGATEIRGDALHYDNLARVVQLDGRVRARFAGAAGATGRGMRPAGAPAVVLPAPAAAHAAR